MKTLHLLLPLAVALLSVSTLRANDEPTRREWTIDGTVREALVYVPPNATLEDTPVIFDFHGHGGTMNSTARNSKLQTLWPEALVIYPQGLPTAGKLTDPEGKKAGWQHSAGDYTDRDLKFFDAMLASMRKDYHVDNKRVFSTGHSNGGAFTYLLWAVRGDQLAAVAPCAAIIVTPVEQLKPKPLFHMAGENDPLVKFEWQKTSMEVARKLNQCGEGEPWGDNCTLYPSKIGAPVVTFIHPGHHELAPGVQAALVKFLKQQALP